MRCVTVAVICAMLYVTGTSAEYLRNTKPWRPQDAQSQPRKGCQDSDTGPLILTPYIKAGQLDKARERANVSLWRANLTSYSGYFTVNETDNSNMFFWFFPAEVPQPEKAPLVLWLQGGPGASSMFALFVENGPFRIHKSMKLSMRNYRWTKLANMIYIDNPVGTGFSFTGSNDGYSRNEDQVGRNLYQALLQFYTLFPEYQSGSFYVTGESYGGKYVPAIAYRIHLENANTTLRIPLKGIAIGNGLVDPANMMHYGSMLYQMGMLDEIQRDTFKTQEDAFRQAVGDERYVDAFLIFDTLLNGDKYPYPTYFYNATHSKYYFNLLQTVEPADMEYYGKYLEECFVRSAMHVGNQEFSNGSLVEQYMLEDIPQSTAPWLAVLMDNYKVMLYNGQLDIICGAPLTESYLSSLQWSGADAYKKADKIIWKVHDNDTEIAGYVRGVGGFFQVIVRGAGHMVPYDQPRVAFDMIQRFLTYDPSNRNFAN